MIRKNRRGSTLPNRNRTHSDVLALDLANDLRHSHAREAELRRKLNDTVDRFKKLEREHKTLKRNFDALLAESREPRRPDPVGVGYNPRTGECECGKCGWTLENDEKYCPECGTPVDWNANAADEGWAFDAWRERGL